jgi:hypothetical protein
MNANDPGGKSSLDAVPVPRAARRAYGVSALLLAIYALDVLAGKAASLAGIHLEWRLGDFGEFLVVLAMCVTFVAGLMLSENAPSALDTASED